MKNIDPGSQMLDLLHGDAENWLRSLIVRRFAARGHREHGSLSRQRRHLPRLWNHEQTPAQNGQSGA